MSRRSRSVWWVLAVLAEAGCSGGGGEGSSKAHVRVHVIDGDGAGAAAVPVLLSDRDGVVREVIATDADGVVLASLPRGGMATAALDLGIARRLETVAGLEDGDEIWIQRDRGETAVTLEATFPTAFAGGESYGVAAGCRSSAQSGTAGTLTLDLPVECLVSTVGLFVSGSAGDGHPIAYALATPGATSGTVPVSADPWRTDWEDLPLTITGAPADLDVMTVSLGTFIDRRWLVLPEWSETVTAPPAGAFAMKRAPFLGIAQHASAFAVVSSSEIGIETRDAALPGTVTLDLGAALPRVASVSLDLPEVGWTVESAPDEADVLRIAVGAYWNLRLPPGTAAPFTLPSLPPELADWTPPGAAPLTVTYEDADYDDGYDDVRNRDAVGDLLPENWVVRRSSSAN